MEKLRLPKQLTKKGSKHAITWTPEESVKFEQLKTKLVEGFASRPPIQTAPTSFGWTPAITLWGRS